MATILKIKTTSSTVITDSELSKVALVKDLKFGASYNFTFDNDKEPVVQPGYSLKSHLRIDELKLTYSN